MRENFLTIPDAPRYEINSDLICRVKATGQILTLQIDYKNFCYYSLRRPDKLWCIKRSPKTLRRQAVEAAKLQKQFLPIPSTGGRYEISLKGVVRNARLKQILKRKGKGKCIELWFSGRKSIMRCVADLLWEVHGIIKKRRFRPVRVSVENRHGKFFFQNMKSCARFLVDKIRYSFSKIYRLIFTRKPVVGDWTVTYLDEQFADVNWKSYVLSGLARRQAKLEATK